MAGGSDACAGAEGPGQRHVVLNFLAPLDHGRWTGLRRLRRQRRTCPAPRRNNSRCNFVTQTLSLYFLGRWLRRLRRRRRTWPAPRGRQRACATALLARRRSQSSGPSSRRTCGQASTKGRHQQRQTGRHQQRQAGKHAQLHLWHRITRRQYGPGLEDLGQSFAPITETLRVIDVHTDHTVDAQLFSQRGSSAALLRRAESVPRDMNACMAHTHGAPSQCTWLRHSAPPRRWKMLQRLIGNNVRRRAAGWQGDRKMHMQGPWCVLSYLMLSLLLGLHACALQHEQLTCRERPGRTRSPCSAVRIPSTHL